MTVAGSQIAGSTAASGAANDWQAVRDASDIQFSPLAPLAPPQQPDLPQYPEWLEALARAIGRMLEAVFGPIGRLLGMSWPSFRWVLAAMAAVLLLFLLWRIVAPLIARMRGPRDEGKAEQWAPGREEALALLEDADRLAAAGQFGEATHLLLRRSVRQIRDACPDWLIPATTAREISALPMLPESGRQAFGTIAVRVERSLFALRDLDAGDWAAARAAYADFARLELTA